LDEQRSKTVNHHKTQIETLSTFSRQIFQELFDDDLAMGRIKLPSSSNNENVRMENATINRLQLERVWLIEHLLYSHRVDNLLITWSRKIHQMALDSVSAKKSTQWLTMWSTNLENRLNNYKCAGDWFSDFQQLVSNTNISLEVQRLVAYMMLEKTIRITFKQVQNR